MPVRPTYPGVYIEEIPSGLRPVAGVATSITAFIGTFSRGLLDEAVHVLSQSDFEREFGGIERNSETSYAVQQFFLNGGTDAYLVRVGHDGSGGATAIAASTVTLPALDGSDLIDVTAGRRIRGQSAVNPGAWGDNLRIAITHNGTDDDATFNLVVSELRIAGATAAVVTSEAFNNLTTEPNTANNVIDVVNQGSRLVQLALAAGVVPAAPFPRPQATGMVSGELGGTRPVFADLDGLSITIAGSGAAAQALTIAPDVPPNPTATERQTQASFVNWAQRLQTAIRAVAPRFAPELQTYLSGATVAIIGDGTAAQPRHFVVTPGVGPRTFAADTLFVFSGADVANYALEPATAAANATEHLPTPGAAYALDGGDDGTVLDGATYAVPLAVYQGNAGARTGLWALEDVDLFNILCLPDAARLDASEARSLYAAAEAYVSDRRAMLIVDIPEAVRLVDQMHAWLSDNESLRHPNGAVYYPRTVLADPLNQGRARSVASSGTIAGLWARTDGARGVWKAPAGTEARLRNVESLAYQMTDLENGTLNPLGVNALRTFPIYSNICWGARTLDGADLIASDFKYIPVRRITLFIEESLYRGTKWVVFEPNDEPLWAQIRMNVGSFMYDLFRQGAFQGTTARDAFFVKCDKETTTQSDIDNGIVNIEVGFAPLKPAEFVIIKIHQIVRRPEA
ncbi:phage tail sheath C-terminal domain-containing protein [Sinorhizobium sp. BG8]|uniref:phage tail sheath C-terminal domain-containing protein n=1 Tax=Sinorhizobium sp. BG8 TaxID=2613773 RepID=UPI00193DB7C2|nr:phage tail sheath C-terminal domain-containing protein [Sinorhizobium sp. BG8]QRM54381.1 phage tail protein [Sinorhizobium sp. BG8]